MLHCAGRTHDVATPGPSTAERSMPVHIHRARPVDTRVPQSQCCLQNAVPARSPRYHNLQTS